MSWGSWEGLDGARARGLSEAFSKGAEWSSSEKERFSRAALEPSSSSCSERGVYWEELGFSWEVDMSRVVEARTERATGRERTRCGWRQLMLKQTVALVPDNCPGSETAGRLVYLAALGARQR